MEKLLLTLATLALLGSVVYLNMERVGDESIPESVQLQFKQFKHTYNKKYSSSEDDYRLQVYYDNLKFAQAYNEAKGEEVFGETMFFDLTDQEFQETYLTELIPEINPQPVDLMRFTAPADSVDWRQKGAVTPIKDQGKCGSCWAFSTTGVLEGYFKVKSGSLPSLAEQQLVDCAGILYGNLGCNGGMPSRALNYVESKGLTTEDQYAYKAVQDKCQVTGGAFKNKAHQALTASHDALINGLQVQPVSVAVDATNWKYYDPTKQLIFSDCDSKMNHAVLAVGYTADYYIVKNSWTTAWGKDGYIYLKTGNTCGVWNAMVVPT